jgi:hypothetical protein|tara:strand:- start:11070 stop:11690 length:621 start_codon:yes stop_codon:yes gene_type:complete
MPLPIAAMMIPGAITALGSLIGGKQRREDQRIAREEYNSRKSDYQNMEFSNPYSNMTNVYEDLEVNTQQADYMSQQQNQSSANMMDALSASAGGSGVAGLAQSLANANTQAAQQSSMVIGQQEQANQQAMMGEQSRLNNMEAQGNAMVDQQEQTRTKTLLGMSQTRYREANQARQKARDTMMAGIGQMGSAMISGVDAGAKMFKTT